MIWTFNHVTDCKIGGKTQIPDDCFQFHNRRGAAAGELLQSNNVENRLNCKLDHQNFIYIYTCVFTSVQTLFKF